jgi:hypothetical protein
MSYEFFCPECKKGHGYWYGFAHLQIPRLCDECKERQPLEEK